MQPLCATTLEIGEGMNELTSVSELDTKDTSEVMRSMFVKHTKMSLLMGRKY